MKAKTINIRISCETKKRLDKIRKARGRTIEAQLSFLCDLHEDIERRTADQLKEAGLL